MKDQRLGYSGSLYAALYVSTTLFNVISFLLPSALSRSASSLTGMNLSKYICLKEVCAATISSGSHLSFVLYIWCLVLFSLEIKIEGLISELPHQLLHLFYNTLCFNFPKMSNPHSWWNKKLHWNPWFCLISCREPQCFEETNFWVFKTRNLFIYQTVCFFFSKYCNFFPDFKSHLSHLYHSSLPSICVHSLSSTPSLFLRHESCHVFSACHVAVKDLELCQENGDNPTWHGTSGMFSTLPPCFTCLVQNSSFVPFVHCDLLPINCDICQGSDVDVHLILPVQGLLVHWSQSFLRPNEERLCASKSHMDGNIW